ncbi:MAG: peptide chain release factor 2 [Alphaproteobacteria bacterium]|nr:peptide chain release factor 2 [Alphaproteobacteria bacterium]
MRSEHLTLCESIDHSLRIIRRHFDVERATKRLSELNQQAENPQLWDNPEKAQKILKERTSLENGLQQYHDFVQQYDDAKTLYTLGEEANDPPSVLEAAQLLEELKKHLKLAEIECIFSGEADSNNCFLEIHAGAGGTDSQDWALMMMRMYVRWAERHRFKTEILDEQPGEEAGIKSATIRINGHNAYGWAKTESGVHRLVRISPFNSQGKRQTSFASAWVYPEIDDSIDIVIEDKDLRIDTFRSSGAGGQHVNTTDSAVRITHLPTNIVAQCQNNRSQHRNRDEAMAMLRSRLYERELQQRQAQVNALNASKTDNAWGHQIRSYVLHPYQLVKDLRTSHETGNIQDVLDGNLDAFITASLTAQLEGKTLTPTDETDD